MFSFPVSSSGIRTNPSDSQRHFRLRVLITFFSVGFLCIAGRLVSLAQTPTNKIASPASTLLSEAIVRPDVVDRKGQLLATDIKISSLYADPSKILDIDDVVEKITRLFPTLDRDNLRRKLSDKKSRFAWLKRGLTPDQIATAHDLGLPGVSFVSYPHRVYPTGSTAAHILGFVDIDNRGLAGIEKYIDQMAGVYFPKSLDKNDRMVLRLSVDIGVQYILHQELISGLKRYQARAAAGLVLDVVSGEVIALSSVPDFDPNHREKATEKNRFNRIMSGSYELGSVFKVFTTAMALDLGVVTLRDRYDTRKPIEIDSHKIDDYHPKRRLLNIPEIFVYSSNIGAAKMAVDVGVERHQSFLDRLGLLQSLTTELGLLRAPLAPKRWGKVHSMTIGFGHGLSLTPMQFASSAMALVNGGYRLDPTFLYRSRKEGRAQATKILKSETSHVMSKLMRLNVVSGTGRQAAADGYRVGGKTGTAEKIAPGGYSKDKLLTSFLSVFPSDDPAYLVFVMFDEPQMPVSEKGEKETQKRPTAGLNAAPTTSRIISLIAPILEVVPRHTKDGKIPTEFDDLLRASY